MFVLCKKKTDRLAFYVAKCERVDGQPRQKVIAYLASIRHSTLVRYGYYFDETVPRVPLSQHKQLKEFWRTVSRKDTNDFQVTSGLISGIEKYLPWYAHRDALRTTEAEIRNGHILADGPLPRQAT